MSAVAPSSSTCPPSSSCQTIINFHNAIVINEPDMLILAGVYSACALLAASLRPRALVLAGIFDAVIAPPPEALCAVACSPTPSPIIVHDRDAVIDPLRGWAPPDLAEHVVAIDAAAASLSALAALPPLADDRVVDCQALALTPGDSACARLALSPLACVAARALLRRVSHLGLGSGCSFLIVFDRCIVGSCRFIFVEADPTLTLQDMFTEIEDYIVFLFVHDPRVSVQFITDDIDHRLLSELTVSSIYSRIIQGFMMRCRDSV